MVPTALQVAEPWPSHRIAPSLYGLAVQNLRVRLRAHTSSPRPSESEYPPHPRNDVPTLFTPLPSARTITQTSRILKRLRVALRSRPRASGRGAWNIIRTRHLKLCGSWGQELGLCRRALCSSVSRSGFRGEVFFKLSLLIPVVVGVCRCLFLGGDIGPFFGILAIKLEPLLKSGLGIGLDRIHRAFRLAHATVDALVGVNDEHVFAFVEAVDRTDLHAIGELTLDAVFIDDVGHARGCFVPVRAMARFRVAGVACVAIPGQGAARFICLRRGQDGQPSASRGPPPPPVRAAVIPAHTGSAPPPRDRVAGPHLGL